MNAKRGYYSLVQFCPDPSRAEAVNFGVVLFCPEESFLDARILGSNRPAAKLIARERLDRIGLNAAKRALERRLQVDRQAFQTIEDLQRFVDSRANDLKLTPPRPVKVVNPEEELERLFAELVGGRSRRKPSQRSLPELDGLFRRLAQEQRAKLDWTVRIPFLERDMRIPYAYRNGIWNLVKPHVFSAHEGPALSAASYLAVEGDLLSKHAESEQGKKRLIVVGSFEPGEAARQIEDRVGKLLAVYGVRMVPDSKSHAFAVEVEREAHVAEIG